MILVYLSILFVFIYTISMCLKIKSIPSSISETYYKGGGIAFICTMFISSFLATAGLLELSTGSTWQFVSFFTGAGLAFVGAAPLFYDKFEGIIHKAGAATLLLGSLIWLLIYSTPWIMLMWIPMAIAMFSKNRIFWLEVLVILSVGLGLI